MTELPLIGKVRVVVAVVRTSATWALPVLAIGSSPFGSDFSLSRATVLATLLTAVAAATVCVCFPHAKLGAAALQRLAPRTTAPQRRTVNLAEELHIATGDVRPHRVLVIDSPVPDVAALPGPDHTTVIVTSGAQDLLSRDQLNALLASQIVVASDAWVRVASATQLLGAAELLLVAVAVFANPFVMPLLWPVMHGPRHADMTRDMVADFTALRATRYPDALARSLLGLRPAALHASRLWVGLPACFVDQYWVLSTRKPTTTWVGNSKGTRTWTSVDEIAAEMTMRADRILRGSKGDDAQFFDVRSWKRAVYNLGTDHHSPAGFPLRLTPEERAIADQIGEEVRRRTPPPRVWTSPPTGEYRAPTRDGRGG